MDYINIIVKNTFLGGDLCKLSDISEFINAFWGINEGHFPYLTPLWFVRDLFIICIFSPIIIFLCKKYSYIFISILSCMLVFNSYLTFIHLGEWLCIYFFSLGIFTQIMGINLAKKGQLIDLTLTILTAILFILSLTNSSIINKVSSNILIVCLLLIFFRFTIRLVAKYGYNKKLECLSKGSFFVYALHCVTIFHLSLLQMCLWSTRKILCADINEFGLIISYFITPFVCYGICYVIYWILIKKMPTIVYFISGNR